MNVIIIGSGIAGISFAEELAKLEPATSLTVLTREGGGYYSRPLLSHGFTRDDIETKIVLRSFEALHSAGIQVISRTDVLRLDVTGKTVTYRGQADELTLPYDRLILALGSEAFIPQPFLPQRALFEVLNSLDDLIRLRRQRAEFCNQTAVTRWAVIGGGLIGCEVAADLAKAGDKVTLFHALDRLMERQLVPEDSTTLLQVLQREMDIEVCLNAAVQGFTGSRGALEVKLSEGTRTGFHGIIVACGFKPRTDLAKEAGLNTRRGVLVDNFMRTNAPEVYAIGDVAECPDGRLYAYVTPARSQAIWLAQYLAGQTGEAWQRPAFKPKAKVPGFTAAHPYLF